jgi:hypothetical protein
MKSVSWWVHVEHAMYGLQGPSSPSILASQEQLALGRLITTLFDFFKNESTMNP